MPSVVIEYFLAFLHYYQIKTEETYTRLLREIVARINGDGLGQILVDFEGVVINAIITTIPNVVTKGCFYHLCSNVWKHIQRLGHQVRYVEEPEFSLCLRMLSALAFLSPQNVIPGFEELFNDVRANYQDVVDEHFEYFEDTYIGRYRQNAPRR